MESIVSIVTAAQLQYRNCSKRKQLQNFKNALGNLVRTLESDLIINTGPKNYEWLLDVGGWKATF